MRAQWKLGKLIKKARKKKEHLICSKRIAICKYKHKKTKGVLKNPETLSAKEPI